VSSKREADMTLDEAKVAYSKEMAEDIVRSLLKDRE
jgi:hypothetical protein